MVEALLTELEKIDILRERMGLTYEEARVALQEAEGDVVKALAKMEKGQQGVTGELKDRSWDMWKDLRGKFRKLGHTRINIRHKEKTILSVSAPIGLALAYSIFRRPGLRMLGMVGLASAALGQYNLEVENTDDNFSGPVRRAYDETELGLN